ncbi:hypothetical protein [Allorhizobium taibaishanense]|nr:hypothetical protein [Allorhizobium taibaishanense]MBB4009725.1 hypothetical protein [Allorhizobium taibaishanense]
MTKDGVALSTAPAAPAFPVERTIRLGAAHDDSDQIGLLFSSPQRQPPSEEIPQLSPEMIEDLAEIKAQAPPEESRLPASWLDAMTAGEDKAGPVIERATSYLSDDNGLYRMFLADVA